MSRCNTQRKAARYTSEWLRQAMHTAAGFKPDMGKEQHAYLCGALRGKLAMADAQAARLPGQGKRGVALRSRLSELRSFHAGRCG